MEESFLNKIIRAVAAAKGVGPMEMDITLGEHIDFDAIELLAEDDASTWRLTFALPDYNVTVTSDERIEVTERQGNPLISRVN